MRGADDRFCVVCLMRGRIGRPQTTMGCPTEGADSMIWRDILYALRTMRKKPAFAATAVLTLALAIGGNTAMFTVIRAVLLKPLEYRDSDRLVRISGGATPTRFAEMRAGANSFTDLGAYGLQEDLTLSGAGEPEVLRGAR